MSGRWATLLDGTRPRYHLYVDGRLYSIHFSERQAREGEVNARRYFRKAEIECRTVLPGEPGYELRTVRTAPPIRRDRGGP